MANSFYFYTLQLHAGQQADPTMGARAVPVYQTTPFSFQNAKHGANVFALKERGNIYTRIMNSTTDVFEQKMAAFEGGVTAVATASVQAHQFLALQNLLQAGQNFLTTSSLHGGTSNPFKRAFKHLGIEARFSDGAKPASFEALMDEQTKAIDLEKMGDAPFNLADFEAITELAKVGDGKTLTVHPATTAHQHVSEEEPSVAGVRPGLLWESVGYGHIGDIKANVPQAFYKIKHAQ